MTDLIRLSDDPDVPSELRRALSAEKRQSPPPALSTAVWGVVAAQLHTSTAVGAAGTAVVTSAAAGTVASGASSMAVATLGTLKAFAIGMGLGTVALGVPTWIEHAAGELRPSAPAASTRPPSHTVVKPQEPIARRGIEPPAPGNGEAPRAPSSPTPPAALRVLAPSAASSRGPSDIAERTRIETKLVRDARTRLRSGDSAGALRVLSELDGDVPRGVLAQEREALRVEALFAAGNAAEATRAADAFLARHAESPHAGRIRALVLRTHGSQ